MLKVPLKLQPTIFSAAAAGSATLRTQYCFVPLAVVETLRALGEEVVTFYRDIGRRIVVATGEPRSTQFLFQRLSIAIQRGNAASVLGTASSARCVLFVTFQCTVNYCVNRTLIPYMKTCYWRNWKVVSCEFFDLCSTMMSLLSLLNVLVASLRLQNIYKCSVWCSPLVLALCLISTAGDWTICQFCYCFTTLLLTGFDQIKDYW